LSRRAANLSVPLARAAVAPCLRVAAALVVLALGAGTLSGQERGTPPKLDPPPKQAGGMTFTWVKEGPADKCGSACKEWVSAKGAIMPETARDFETFARGRDLSGKVVVLESPGGAVTAGLALGRAFRRLNMTVAVGQTAMLPADASGEQRASYSPKAVCASMCPFVLLGGVRRHVPPESRILVHQIWPGAARADSTAAIYAAQHVAGLLRATSEIARYTVDMGGEIELFDLSMRIPPWEELRVLTNIEVQRTRLNTIDTPFPSSDAEVSVPPGVLPSTGGQIASFQRWTLVGNGSERSVVRRHPLTREGEEIGTLLVTIACGEKPMSMNVRYWETRRLASTDDSILRAVMGIGRERVQLTVASSRVVAGRLESIANATVSTGVFAKMFAPGQAGPVTVATLTKAKQQTVIHIGLTGLGQVMPQLAKECPR
jgi:hypothetical protein